MTTDERLDRMNVALRPGERLERWVCMGEYPGVSKARVTGFRKPDGSLTYFGRVRGATPGYAYDVVATETGIRAEPTWTGEQADDYLVIRLEAQERKVQLELKTAEARAAKRDPVREAIEDGSLLEHAAKLNWHQREVLTRRVTALINGAR